MANGMWQQTEEMAKKHDQGGSLWLKLAGDGDKAVVVFLGEPHPRRWPSSTAKYVEVDAKMKAAGTKASLRVALNVASTTRKEVKVLEQGVMFFRTSSASARSTASKWAFEIQRHGAAKDPRPRTRSSGHQLSVEQQKAFQALPQHDLAKLYSGEADGGRRVASRSTATTRRATRRATAPWPQRRAGLVTALKARCRARRRTSSSRSSASSASGPADVAGGEGARSSSSSRRRAPRPPPPRPRSIPSPERAARSHR